MARHNMTKQPAAFLPPRPTQKKKGGGGGTQGPRSQKGRAALWKPGAWMHCLTAPSETRRKAKKPSSSASWTPCVGGLEGACNLWGFQTSQPPRPGAFFLGLVVFFFWGGGVPAGFCHGLYMQVMVFFSVCFFFSSGFRQAYVLIKYKATVTSCSKFARSHRFSME